MLLVRPVAIDDLEALLALAGIAGVGLTTLPRDRDLLKRRINKSVRCFEQIPDRPGGESYLFVMVDLLTGQIVGASGIVAKVGGFEPFYAFRIERIVNRSDELNVNKEVALLQLVREHNGPAEIGSLFLAPAYRGGSAGRFLQLVRFMFLAQHPEAFETEVVSELRGVIDENGHSAFWDALGRHFFDIDFPRADYLSVVNKKFIGDLMPTHPIYISLLPQAAQQVIGKVHDQTRPALRVLEGEGFAFNGMVDIFDAGACVSCQRDHIRTVRECQTTLVAQIDERAARDEALCMVARIDEPFRACLDEVVTLETGVAITSACARALQISVEHRVSVASLRPAARRAPTAPGVSEKSQ